MVILFISTMAFSQVDSITNNPVTIDLTTSEKLRTIPEKNLLQDRNQQLTPQQKKKRIWLVAGGNVVAYSTTMIGLYSAWYIVSTTGPNGNR